MKEKKGLGNEVLVLYSQRVGSPYIFWGLLGFNQNACNSVGKVAQWRLEGHGFPLHSIVASSILRGMCGVIER